MGFGYAVEKAPTTIGWTYPGLRGALELRVPTGDGAFARCVRGKVSPIATGEDGRFVLEAIFAAYASAGRGQRIALPYRAPAEVQLPIEGWLGKLS